MGALAGRIDINQHEDIRLIERAAEFGPKVLGTGVAMGLKEHQQAIELAARPASSVTRISTG